MSVLGTTTSGTESWAVFNPLHAGTYTNLNATAHPFTFAAVVKISSTSAGQDLLNAQSANPWTTDIAGGLGTGGATVGFDDDSGQRLFTPSPALVAGDWYIFVATNTSPGTANDLTIYSYNITTAGGWLTSPALTGSVTTDSAPAFILIGGHGNEGAGGGDFGKNGANWALAAIWAGVALTSTQVQALSTNLRTSDWWSSAGGRPDFLVECTSLTPTDIGANASTFSATSNMSLVSDTSGWTFDQHGRGIPNRRPAIRPIAARRPGRISTVVPPQVPVPKPVFANRSSSARSKAAMLRRGRATNPTLTQAAAAPPAMVPAPIRQRRVLAAQVKGKQPGVIPAQVQVPVAAPPNRTDQLLRRLFAGQPRGHQTTPVPAQVPVPTWPPRQVTSSRRLLGLVARGKQPNSATMSGLTPISPPVIYSPLTTAGRQFQRLARIRGKRTDVIHGQGIPQPVRSSVKSRGVFPVRGRKAVVPVAAQQAIAPTWPPSNRQPAVRRLVAAVRGRPAVPQSQAAPPAGGRPPVRWIGQRRAKRIETVPPQVPVPPTIPGNRTDSQRSKIAAVRRGRISTPVPTQQTIVPPSWPPRTITSPRRVVGASSRGKRSTPISGHAPVPYAAKTAPRRVVAARRGRQVIIVPAQIPVPLPVFPVRAPTTRRTTGQQRGRRTTIVVTQTGTIPSPPSICYPAIATLDLHALAATLNLNAVSVVVATPPARAAAITIPPARTITLTIPPARTAAVSVYSTAASVTTPTRTSTISVYTSMVQVVTCGIGP